MESIRLSSSSFVHLEPLFEISKLTFKNQVALLNSDFMSFNNETLYDLIIGNPPYFVMSKDEVEPNYYSYFDGRPNIFILFIK